MATHDLVKIFDSSKIRVVWDDEQEKYFFSVVDVVGVLTESGDYQLARNYWKVLKHRLIKEGLEPVTICNQLKLVANDGKRRETDVADLEGILRIIQSIPSKKAEPIKRWLAQVGSERFQQLQDPERSIEQAILDYRRLGYSEAWINQRIKTIEIRKGLTDEWKRSGVESELDYASLTDIMYRAWSGMTAREYKKYKGLRQESLRDNMTNVELMLNGLAEAAATEISHERNPQGYDETAAIANEGGEVADAARQNLEQRLGRSVISNKRAVNFTTPPDELPLPKDPDELDDITDLGD
jgi:hypothetical protein